MRDKQSSILYIVLGIIIVVSLYGWFAKIIWDSDLPTWLKILFIIY